MSTQIIAALHGFFEGLATGGTIIASIALIYSLPRILNELRRCRRLLVDIADNTQQPEP